MPDNSQRPISKVLNGSINTDLTQMFGQDKHSDTDHTRFFLLGHGVDAFVARAILADKARRSIDAQYYLLHDDTVGRLFLEVLMRAAERGVRVRLLVDDMDLAKTEYNLSALDQHPNVEIRAFNPFSRYSPRSIQYLTRFGTVTRRMHNKSFTVDNQLTIVGGRNIGDEYFDADSTTHFGDLDVLVSGTVVDKVSASFDEFWNDELAYPISSLVKKQPNKTETAKIRAQYARFFKDNLTSPYIQALYDSELVNTLKANALKMYWGKAQVLVDSPKKLRSKRNRTDLHMLPEIAAQFSRAKREIIIFSPYFVPTTTGTVALAKLAKKGIKVRVVTNSLASNDHAIVYAGYARYRKDLLRAGVELYEVRAHDANHARLKKSVLHAKSFIIDRQHVFIGSLNFDPRSFTENTEIGIIFASDKLAQEMTDWFDDNIMQVAYRLQLQTDAEGNESLVWHTKNKQQKVNWTVEPETTVWKRFMMHLMGLLPGESQL